MTEAYAIKEPDGKILTFTVSEDQDESWHMICQDQNVSQDQLEAVSYTCVPVTVSEFEEPLSPELAKKYSLDRRLRIFIEQLMLADDVAKEFDYEEAKRLHRELVDRLTAVSEKGEAEKRFPMQRGPSIPWSLAEAIYAGYSSKYGASQSLQRLADRGGFSWAEVEIIYKESGDVIDAYLSRGQG